MANPVNTNLSREESRDSYQGSLQEIDPSPVEETPIEYFNESYFPDDKERERQSPPGFGASTLGLGNHGPAFYCNRSFPTSHRLQVLIKRE
jgi:hypothetical protein